jgi:hypothetical protein
MDYFIGPDRRFYISGEMPVGGRIATQEEIDFNLNQNNWIAYQNQAKIFLEENDIVAIRCVKASVPYPSEWLDYDMKLRTIVHAISGDASVPFPQKPDNRPAGT